MKVNVRDMTGWMYVACKSVHPAEKHNLILVIVDHCTRARSVCFVLYPAHWNDAKDDFVIGVTQGYRCPIVAMPRRNVKGIAVHRDKIKGELEAEQGTYYDRMMAFAERLGLKPLT